MDKSSPPTGQRRLFRLALGIAIAGALLAGGTISTNAFHQSDAFAHYVLCFQYMLTDPAQHRQQCSPFNGPITDPASLTGVLFSTPVTPTVVPTTTTTTTTTVVVPDPPTDETTTTTWSDYCPPPTENDVQAISCEF